MQKKFKLQVHIPDNLNNYIVKKAKDEQKTKSQVIREILEWYIVKTRSCETSDIFNSNSFPGFLHLMGIS